MQNGIVLDKFKMVYWFVPKNACTTLKTYFAEKIGLDYNGSVHDARFTMIDEDEAEDHYKDYFHFAYVRNPIARILSTFNNKVADEFSDYVFRNHKALFYEGMPFDVFVNSVIFAENPDPHFMAQSPQVPLFCHIIKIEDDPFIKTLNKLNPSQRPRELPHNYELVRHKLVRHFYNDFSRFNYFEWEGRR